MEPIRKRKFSKGEVLEKLKSHGRYFQSASEEICHELLKEDWEPDDETSAEVDKLSSIIEIVRARIDRLYKENRKGKFRRFPDELDQTLVSASQFSLFGSQKDSTIDSQGIANAIQSTQAESQPKLDTTQNQSLEYKKKPITSEMHPRSRRRRVAVYREEFSAWASNLQCSPSQLCGLIIYLENYLTNKELSNQGWMIFNESSSLTTHKATVHEAIWMMERGKLSEAVYLEIRLRFLDRFVLPALHLVASVSKKSRPDLTPYRQGVRARLSNCLELTLKERLQILDLSELQNTITFSFSYGLDGSGQHQNFQQMSKIHFSTKQIMSVCFALKEIHLSDGTLIWSSSEKGSNKPQNVRPLALFPEKESDALLKEFIPLIDNEVKKLEENGLTIENNQQLIKANVKNATMSMLDGKMVTRLLQLGGGYCTMCPLSLEECHDENKICAGFQITRSVETLKDLALALEDPETGEIRKRPKDYPTRTGLTAHPITSANVTTHIPVCHSKIRSFEWFIDLLVRENSHQKWSSNLLPVKYTNEEKEMFMEARNNLKVYLNEKLAINIGDPSDMVTGESFKKFSSDSAREVLADFIKDISKQEAFKDIHLQTCAIVLVINSQKKESYD